MTKAKPWRDHYYRSADGRLDLFARDYPASGPDGDLPPLLLMHGLTRNSADFEPLIELLGTGKRRMIVPDQRGRGLSQHDPDPANYRPDVYVEDMWVLLGELGIDRVICIGTSMGGLMAMVMGAQQPQRIAGIVLNDVGPEVSQEGLERIRSYVGPGKVLAGWDDAAARCEAINASAIDGFGPEDWMAFARRTCRENADGSVEFAYDPAIARSMEDEQPATVPPDLWALWDALANIPVLAIRGAKSDILSASTLAQMAERRGGDLAFVELPGRGHAPILDEPFAITAIRAFLAQ